MKNPFHRILILLVLPLVATSCLSSGPVVEMGEGAEVSYDGLHRVRHARAGQRVWVKPDLDLSGYSEVILLGAGFHYKRPPRRQRGEYALDEKQKAFVRDELSKAMSEELTANGDWQLVSEAGPKALVIRGAIIDFLLTAPPDQPTRGNSYNTSIGAATLVVEVFDSESLEILARVIDRRGMNHDETTGWRNAPVSNAAAARKTFARWARKLSHALDTAREADLARKSDDG